MTGVSILLSQLFGLPLSGLIFLINLPFIGMGLRHIGRKFALKSTLAIIGLSLCLAFLNFPEVTHDKLLTAIFGGFFLGGGIGLAIRGGAVLDGTEIAALIISKASSLLKVGDVILLVNVFIFLVAAIILGVEPALYSVLTYISASKMIDFLLHGVEEFTAVIIISSESEIIRKQIIHEINRGLTVYQAKGGKSGNSQDVLYCVVTRLEIGKIKSLAREHDPSAFIIVHPLAEAEGGFKNPRLSHHH